MHEPKVTDLDYITFLVAAQGVVSCTEGARVQPDEPGRAAHDALNRLLYRLEPDTTPLWLEAEALVHRHWSGKHRTVVSGINPGPSHIILQGPSVKSPRPTRRVAVWCGYSAWKALASTD